MTRTDKLVTFGALGLFVFPIGYLVAYMLVSLPIGLALDLFLPSVPWVFMAVDWLGRLTGIAAGIWLCSYAWPGGKRVPWSSEKHADSRSNTTNDE